MVFSSVLFIFAFLPFTLACYFLAWKAGGIRPANLVLLGASMGFYAWGGLRFFLILLAVIAVNYLLTLAMDRVRGNLFLKRTCLILILLADLGNLLYFKYFNFLAENLRHAGSLLGLELFETLPAVVLPIGISFYTFQILSYAADLYLGRVPLQKNPLDLALYVMMFPQLIAGPIVRYSDINEEIGRRRITAADLEAGSCRFIRGFAKKVFLANACGRMADTIFAMPGKVNCGYAWLGAASYALQIYYDFSAYSDMAIGIGRILGFHFAENFNQPYLAAGIQEFWRRWHISLSSWFRDYVYIPLGGNRRGSLRTYCNLALVFLLTGFWHGAAWQFVIWGLFHGFFSVLERLGLGRLLKRLPRLIARCYTMLVVLTGWVFFRADDLPEACRYLKNMFSFDFGRAKQLPVAEALTPMVLICLLTGTFFALVKLPEGWAEPGEGKRGAFLCAAYLLLWGLAVLYLTGLSYNPFIYFKF